MVKDVQIIKASWTTKEGMPYPKVIGSNNFNNQSGDFVNSFSKNSFSTRRTILLLPMHIVNVSQHIGKIMGFCYL